MQKPRRLEVLASLLAVGVCILLSAPPALAKDLDFSFKVGALTGNVKTLDSANAVTGTHDFSGVPFVFGYNAEISRWIMFQAEAGLVLDFTGLQLSRSGIDIGFLFHVLGASRRYEIDRPYMNVVTREPFALSLVLRAGIQRYGFQSGTSTVTGTLLETSGGLQLRSDISERAAFFVEGTTTIAGISASLEKLRSQLILVAGGLRIFL